MAEYHQYQATTPATNNSTSNTTTPGTAATINDRPVSAFPLSPAQDTNRDDIRTSSSQAELELAPESEVVYDAALVKLLTRRERILFLIDSHAEMSSPWVEDTTRTRISVLRDGAVYSWLKSYVVLK
jgi:hypothetical protein